jgi:hypothetical protein
MPSSPLKAPGYKTYSEFLRKWVGTAEGRGADRRHLAIAFKWISAGNVYSMYPPVLRAAFTPLCLFAKAVQPRTIDAELLG